MEYGQWVTYAGKRYMITDWTAEDVQLWHSERGTGFWVGRHHVTEVSDFMQTDSERKALGYAF
jgi:hypothetical protein